MDKLQEHLSSRIDALRDVVDDHDLRNKERFQAAKEAVVAAMTASEKALSKAEAAAERRFESVNEFRGALADQARQLLPRAEYIVEHRALEDKVSTGQRTLEEKLSILLTRIAENSARIGEVEAAQKGRALGASGVQTFLYGLIIALGSAISAVVAVLTVGRPH